MHSLRDLQLAFVGSVFGGSGEALAYDIVAGAVGAGERLEVYRNNAYHNLREALRAVYPVVERLVGTAFFDHAADNYVTAYSSRSGDLHRFGAEFADFLAALPAASGLPYLPDTARLEWLVHEVFHGAEQAPLEPQRLGQVPQEHCGSLIFHLHPACRLLASAYPVHRIWQVNQPEWDAGQTVELDAGGVGLLVRRNGSFGTELQVLERGEFVLLDALARRLTLTQAFDLAAAADPAADVAGLVQRHVGCATLVDFDLGAA